MSFTSSSNATSVVLPSTTSIGSRFQPNAPWKASSVVARGHVLDARLAVVLRQLKIRVIGGDDEGVRPRAARQRDRVDARLRDDVLRRRALGPLPVHGEERAVAGELRAGRGAIDRHEVDALADQRDGGVRAEGALARLDADRLVRRLGAAVHGAGGEPHDDVTEVAVACNQRVAVERELLAAGVVGPLLRRLRGRRRRAAQRDDRVDRALAREARALARDGALHVREPLVRHGDAEVVERDQPAPALLHDDAGAARRAEVRRREILVEPRDRAARIDGDGAADRRERPRLAGGEVGVRVRAEGLERPARRGWRRCRGTRRPPRNARSRRPRPRARPRRASRRARRRSRAFVRGALLGRRGVRRGQGDGRDGRLGRARERRQTDREPRRDGAEAHAARIPRLCARNAPRRSA